MNETTVISVKTDKSTKNAAQKVAHDLGIPLSTVLNAYLRQFVRDKAVSVHMEPKLLPEVEKELLAVIKEARAGKNLSPTFSSMKDANDYLNKL
jgi:addiction module RelB/DinJ family antitoxin